MPVFPSPVLRLLAFFLLFSTVAHADLDASLPPAANHDLRHWKLGLPVDASGGNEGVAIEVSLLAAYSSAYFYTAADGSMVFRAPVNGATTKNSSYPRSELREMLNPVSAAVNWTDEGQSILEANLKVNRVPVTGKLIIGQIHGYDLAPLVKLQYEYKSGVGKVYALINTTPTATTPDKRLLAQGIALDKAFYYRIKVYKRLLYLSVNGASPTILAIDPSWQGVGFYFKAGAYVQARGSDAEDYGQASFYRLSATHPNDKLTVSDTVLPAAIAGQYYAQSLSSSGGLGTVLWSMLSGRLPAGLKLDASSGAITGIPLLQTGDGKIHSFTVQARDGVDNTAARTLSITIAPMSP